jgi:hypothetical protein
MADPDRAPGALTWVGALTRVGAAVWVGALTWIGAAVWMAGWFGFPGRRYSVRPAGVPG